MVESPSTAKQVVEVFSNWCIQYGFPRFARTDWGPQLRNAFAQLHLRAQIVIEPLDRQIIEYSKVVITKQVSSSYHPINNGLAERNLGFQKIIFKKAIAAKQDLQQTLGIIRNTPRTNMAVSPSYLFSGREISLSGIPGLIRDVDLNKAVK